MGNYKMWSDTTATWDFFFFFNEATQSELRQLFSMFFFYPTADIHLGKGKDFKPFWPTLALFTLWLQPGLPFSQQLLWDHCLPTKEEQSPNSRINFQPDSPDNHPNQDVVTRNVLAGCRHWAYPVPQDPFCVTMGQSRDFWAKSPKYCIYYLDILALGLFYLCAF